MTDDAKQDRRENGVGSRELVRPLQRCQWLMAWIEKHRYADALNADLVDEYAEATGAKLRLVNWGAHHCPMLGRDLSRMARCGALNRWRNGLRGTWQPGFPKWVWSYEVGHAAYLFRSNNLDQTRGGQRSAL